MAAHSAGTEHSVVPDVTCTRCGCLCDDIRLHVETSSRIVEAEHACQLGEEWFLSRDVAAGPSCLIEGEQATLEEAYARAAEILAGAKYPLVFGLADATSEAQRAAVAIADWIGACVDTAAGEDAAARNVAVARVGATSATLGEVAHRADLVLFWRTNPAEELPRHFERYSLHPVGTFVPRGRAGRTCVVVDARQTATANEADLFLKISADADLDALWTLRALANGLSLHAKSVAGQTGIDSARWRELAERMKGARYGALFYDPKCGGSSRGHVIIEALLALARDLNHHTRFVALPCAAGGNPTGADNVLAWRTGYPAAVNLARGYPRYGPGEYSAATLLARREPDAALVMGGNALAELPAAAAAHLQSIPRIVLAPQNTETADAATVSFRVGAYGIHTGGTVYRSDGVPLPLRPSLPSPHPAAEQVLHEIQARVIRGHGT